MLRLKLVSPASPLHMIAMLHRRPISAAMHAPRKGTIMTNEKPASASSRLSDKSVRCTDRDQVAGEHYKAQGVAEQTQKAPDRLGRRANPSNRDDSVGGRAPVETTDLERRVLVLDRILQALIAHMAETEPKFIDRLSATFTDPIRVAHQEQNYIDTGSYAERFIREIVRLGEQPRGSRIRTPRNFQNPRQAEQRLVAPLETPDRQVLVFELRHRSGIWEVTQDGRFYGDFLSEREALDGAQAAVRSIVADGGLATFSDAATELGQGRGGF